MHVRIFPQKVVAAFFTSQGKLLDNFDWSSWGELCFSSDIYFTVLRKTSYCNLVPLEKKVHHCWAHLSRQRGYWKCTIRKEAKYFPLISEIQRQQKYTVDFMTIAIEVCHVGEKMLYSWWTSRTTNYPGLQHVHKLFSLQPPQTVGTKSSLKLWLMQI